MANSIFLGNHFLDPYKTIHLISRDKGYNLEEHDHPMFQIIWVTKGILNIVHNGIGYCLRRGHLCVIPPEHRHSLQSEFGYEQLGIDLKVTHDERGIVSLLEAQVEKVVVIDRNEFLPVIARLEKMHKQLTTLAKIQMANILDTLLLSCVETLDSQNSFRSQILDIMNIHFSENQLFPCHLTLNEISNRMAISPSHLERMTNKEFGCSVMGLYYQLKINKACSLLISSNLSMKQIAETLGFFDQAHFSRFFKQKMNITPVQYRKTSVV